jgi:predicted 3-demethylubiquinone-9 3-methyltransferase (glyoxalase superfamily)
MHARHPRIGCEHRGRWRWQGQQAAGPDFKQQQQRQRRGIGLCSLVPGSRLGHILRSPASWPGGEAGDVIMVDFTLGGHSFQGLNGGAPADYGTAASISVECPDQAEVDRLWTALTADGGSEIMCGCLRDRWGLP